MLVAWHPFQKIPSDKRPLVFALLCVVTISLVIIMEVKKVEPRGIISLELAGDVPTAQQIVESWDMSSQRNALFSMRLDFLLTIAYSNTIGLGCFWAAETISTDAQGVSAVGIILAWSQWLAALLDVVENIALLSMLCISVTQPFPTIALWCAVPKFELIVAGLLYTGVAVGIGIFCHVL